MNGTSWSSLRRSVGDTRSEQWQRPKDTRGPTLSTTTSGERGSNDWCENDTEEEDEYSLQAFQDKLDQLTASLVNNVNLERVVLEAKQATTTRHTPSAFFGTTHARAATTAAGSNEDDDPFVYGVYRDDTNHDTDEANRTVPNGEYVDDYHRDCLLVPTTTTTALATPERLPQQQQHRSLRTDLNDSGWHRNETAEATTTTQRSSSFVTASVNTPEPPTPVKTPVRSRQQEQQPPVSSSSSSSPYRHTYQGNDTPNEEDSFLSRPPQHSNAPVWQHPYPATTTTRMGGVAATVGEAGVSATAQTHPTTSVRSTDHPNHHRHSYSGPTPDAATHIDQQHHFVRGSTSQSFASDSNTNQPQTQQYHHPHSGYGLSPPLVTGFAQSSYPLPAGVPTTDGDTPTAIPSRVAVNTNNSDVRIPRRNTAATATREGGTMQDLIVLVEELRDTIDRQERRIRTLEDENDLFRRHRRLHSRSGDNDHRHLTPGRRFVDELAHVMEIPPENYAPLSRIMDLQLNRLVLEDQRRRRSLGYR